MKTLKLYLLSLTLLGIVTLFGLVVTELILRSMSLQESEESRSHVVRTDYLPVKLKPNYSGRLWDIPFSTNRYGFRDEEDFPAIPEDREFRILSMGDSIGFGLGIEAEKHYTKVAQRRLNHPGSEKRYRIVNAGGQGYSPSGYFVYLRHEGLSLHPDMVIVETELCNDVTDEALLRWRSEGQDALPTAVTGGRYLIGWDGNLLGTYSVGGYFYERTYTYTVFIRRLLNLLNRISPSSPMADQPAARAYYSLGFDHYLLDQQRIESGWERLFGALESTKTLLEANGIPFLVLLMPSRYQFEDPSSEWTRFANSLMEKANSMADRRMIPYLNLTQEVGKRGGAQLYFDFAHLTEQGNEVVGEAVARLLKQQEPTIR